MKLLLAEDEAKTAQYLKKGFEENGLVVDVVGDGEAALAAAGPAYDLMILDVMLPRGDGFRVLAELRGRGEALPILMLTARGAVEDRVRGLRGGADDYLVKPFAFSELLARVRNLLGRRGPRGGGETLGVEGLEIDLRHHRAVRDGRRLDLTPKEFKVLELLAAHPGEPLSRTYIAERVWNMNFEGDSNVIDVHIRRLRAKVDDPFERKLIVTVRGVGYRLGGGD